MKIAIKTSKLLKDLGRIMQFVFGHSSETDLNAALEVLGQTGVDLQ